jgi:ribonuclease R
MKLARYHEENLGHFGLATEMYAHFTSPIRRYPDLVVHRALRALRSRERAEARSRGGPGGAERPPAQRASEGLRRPSPSGSRARASSLRSDDTPELAEMGQHLSDMERRAADAERELVEWKKVRFMTDKLGEVYKGYVTGVQAFGLFVELEEIYVQGLVHVSSMTDDYYRFDERAHALKGESTRQVYRLGDEVEVQVVRVDLERRQLDFALVDVLRRAAAGARKVRPPRAPGPRRGGRPGGRSARRRSVCDPSHMKSGGASSTMRVQSGTSRETEAMQTTGDLQGRRSPGNQGGRMSEVRSVALNLTGRELIFLQKVTRQEYHFITDEEQEARLRLRDKLLEGFFDQNENRIVLNLTRDELLFLIKVARENYSFIVRSEKEARLALAAKLHKTAEAVFGVSAAREE